MKQFFVLLLCVFMAIPSTVYAQKPSVVKQIISIELSEFDVQALRLMAVLTSKEDSPWMSKDGKIDFDLYIKTLVSEAVQQNIAAVSQKVINPKYSKHMSDLVVSLLKAEIAENELKFVEKLEEVKVVEPTPIESE